MVKLKKLNNNGSTLILAVVGAAFVLILATVMLALTSTNVMLKSMDYQSKKSFYSVETAVDEIYSGVGQLSVEALADAYEATIGNLASKPGNESGNDLANAELKELFFENTWTRIINGGAVVPNVTDCSYFGSDADAVKAIINTLKTYVTNSTSTNVKITDSLTSAVKADKTNAKITISDVVVTYINPETNVFSSVTVDIVIGYPEWDMDFLTSRNTLKTFLDYGLISDKEIDFGSTSDTYMGTVKCGVYAGADGIWIMNGSTVDANSGEGTFSTSGDISIQGTSTSKSILNLTASRIWAKNILLLRENGKTASDDLSSGAELFINKDSKTYVWDDLELNGVNSTATIGGRYYGYSYGTAVDGSITAADSHEGSSSIVINGKYSSLYLGKAENPLYELYICGRAYVNGVSNFDYLTGESLSIKGNQASYLVLDKYMSYTDATYNNKISNPMVIEPGQTLNIDLTKFFAYSLLDSTNPYIQKDIVKAGKTYSYFYLNFKDKQSATKFFENVLDVNYRATLTAEQQADWDCLNTLVKDNLDNMFIKEDGSNSNSVVNIQTDAASIYSSGTLFELSEANSSVTGVSEELVNAAITVDGVASLNRDLYNRYQLIQSMLLSADEITPEGTTYMVTNKNYVLYNGNYVSINADKFSNSTIENIVKLNLLATEPTIEDTEVLAYGGKKLVTFIKTSSYVIPSDCVQGLVVVDGDVYLDHAFSGLIMATGNIEVTGSGAIDNIFNVDLLLSSEPRYAKYFYAYEKADKPVTIIDEVDYSQVVSFNNWRKYEEE